MLNQILNDSEILTIYNDIEKMEVDTGGWAYHNWTHVNNVAQLVEKLLQSLEVDQDFIEEAKVSALLHDIGSLKGKQSHAIRSYEFAKDYFEKHNLPLNYKDHVLEAIKGHSDGFETDNIMALTLILADKLDITKERLAPAGYQVEGLSEIQFIESIELSISNHVLHVNFITNPTFNKEAFENFYFAQKVFLAIKSFAKKLSLTYEIKLNNQGWGSTI